MKYQHWMIVGFTAVVGCSAVVAQFYPQYATVCHLVSALSAAVSGAMGLTSPEVK